mmetsp:Transcript_18800/g.21242  ORF Transcript_18800/g.21242 Transcript_18800/m.21242 type:complete len:407 (-) Transcript_18800:331-1551(-)
MAVPKEFINGGEEDEFGNFIEQDPDEGLKRLSEQEDNPDGRRWQWAFPQIDGLAPKARGGHSANLVGSSIIIFGGHYFSGGKEGYVYLNDTHVLDVNNNKWIKPRTQGTPPLARYGHTATLAGNRIIIFGGKGKKKHFRDLHALDPVTMTWYQGPEGGSAPTARHGHSATLVNNTKVFIFGGCQNQTFFDDLHILDLEAMSWTRPTVSGSSPKSRSGHSAVLVGNNLIVQGGFQFLSEDSENSRQIGAHYKIYVPRKFYLNDIRVLDVNAMHWSRLRIAGTPPSPAFGHTMSLSGVDIIIFGGWSDRAASKKEYEENEPDYFLSLNTESMGWQRDNFVGVLPPRRYGHTTTVIGPHMLIFGGWEHNRSLNDVIVLRDCSSMANNQQQTDSIDQYKDDTEIKIERQG